jgi:hypothetical protein
MSSKHLRGDINYSGLQQKLRLWDRRVIEIFYSKEYKDITDLEEG